MDWDDDRPGTMRVHIAAHRADLLCKRLTYGEVRAAQRAKGATAHGERKVDRAWALAVGGFVDEHGQLRDGWPS